MKIALVGGYGGVGEELNILLQRGGNEVVTIGHRSGELRLDVTDIGQVSEMFDGLSGINALINCAGISIDGFAHKLTSADWSKVVEVNLIGSYNLAKVVLPAMRESSFGRIIFLSSIVAHKPVLGTSAYSASKAGLEGLTRTLAIENASKGVTCNCVAMGYFDSGMGARLPREQRDTLLHDIPMKRFGRIHELCNVIDMLLETDYITGQTIHINGGLFYQ